MVIDFSGFLPGAVDHNVGVNVTHADVSVIVFIIGINQSRLKLPEMIKQSSVGLCPVPYDPAYTISQHIYNQFAGVGWLLCFA